MVILKLQHVIQQCYVSLCVIAKLDVTSAFNAVTLFIGRQEEHLACKN